MAKFRIKVIQHLLKGNKIAKSGEIVDGKEFIDLQASLNGGYCEEADPKDLEVDHEEVSATEKEAAELDPSDKTDLENMNYDELMTYANDNLLELSSKEKKSKASLREAIKSKM